MIGTRQDGEPIRIDGDVDNLATYEDKEEEEEMEVFVKHDNVLHGQKKNTQKLCSLQFLRYCVRFGKCAIHGGWLETLL